MLIRVVLSIYICVATLYVVPFFQLITFIIKNKSFKLKLWLACMILLEISLVMNVLTYISYVTSNFPFWVDVIKYVIYYFSIIL